MTRIVGEPDDDLTSIVVCEAIRCWASFDPARAKLQTWINSIAIRRHQDSMRSARRTRCRYVDSDELTAVTAHDYAVIDDLVFSVPLLVVPRVKTLWAEKVIHFNRASFMVC